MSLPPVSTEMQALAVLPARKLWWISAISWRSAVSAGFHYQLSNSWDLDLKYRATWVDYESGRAPGQPDYFKYDTVTHGPVVGFILNF